MFTRARPPRPQDTAQYLKSLNTTLNAVKFASKMKKGAAGDGQ